MKTIKQIADELGIDKQKVYRFVKKNHINEVHHEALQKNDVKHYDEVAESLIKSAFLESEVHHEALQTTSNDAVIDVLLMQSEALQKELEIKNRQIEELTKMLADNQKLLDQAQQLHAMSEKKILLLEESNQKRHWWQRKKL